VFLAVALAAAGSGVGAETAPSAACEARRVGDRVLVTLELRDFLQEETRRLLQLGMKGHIAVEAAAFRKRMGLFEHTVASTAVGPVLSSPRDSRELRLDGRALTESAGSFRLERFALRVPADEARAAALTVRATVRLRVVTVSSLSKVAAWAAQSSEDEASSSLITRGILSAVVSDLTRSADCTCRVAASP
jgi:hypothetical protein